MHRKSSICRFAIACATIFISTHIGSAQAPNFAGDTQNANAQNVNAQNVNAQNTGSVSASLDSLRARLEAAEVRVAEGKRPAYSQNMAVWRFKLEQARLVLRQLDDGTASQPWTQQNYLASLLDRADAVEKAHEDAAPFAAFANAPQMHERAYIAQNDGSIQPYWVFVPKNYSPRKKYPLVVFLHGYDPGITKAQPWIPGETTWNLATDRGFLFAVPYGRRNSDFLQIGEDDTLQVLGEVQNQYNIDSARVTLMGASMGGYGALAIGLHTPHLWNGIAPMAARTDIYQWLKLNRDEVLPWKRALYESDDPRSLKENALHVPIYLQHGALDSLVPVTHSRLFFDDLKKLGYAARYSEIADGDHYIYWQANSYQLALDWAAKLRRAPTPRRVRYQTQNLRNNRAYWVTIDALETYGEGARIEAEIGAANVIKVQSQNVAAFTLLPPRELLSAKEPITLEVNGKVVAQNLSAVKPVIWNSLPATSRAALATAFPNRKTPQQSGPIREVYRDAFLLVYGTRGENGETRIHAQDKANAERFAREWQAYADGLPRIKADREVTAEERNNFNLILFGTHETNTLVAECADQLPLELTPQGYRIGTEKVAGQDLGLVFCYPSPFANGRMIVLQSGKYWGAALPLNHKFDLLPDYIVFDDNFDVSDNTNRAVQAGYFDNNWQIATQKAPMP